MREQPHSRSENLEVLKEALVKRQHVNLSWNGYDVSFYLNNSGAYMAIVQVYSPGTNKGTLIVNYDSSMNPTKKIFIEIRGKDAYSLSLEDLPTNLKGREKELADFILTKDFEGMSELDGWTRESPDA